MSSRRPANRVATPVPAESVSNGANGSQRNSVVLGPNDRLRGELYIEGDLHVAGTVDGNIEATGDIEIAGAAKVNGDVTAYNRLTVGRDASLIAGDVRVARLTVADGATFSGKVSMGKQPQKKAEKAPQPKPEPVAEPAVVAELPPAAEPPAVVAPEPVAIEPVAVKTPAVKSAPAKTVPAKPQQKGRRR